MKPFTTLTAVAAPIKIAKIDTGVIVPGRFMRVRRRPPEVDYSDVFLHDLRFDENDRPRADFVLNQPAYQGAGILVTGIDFGLDDVGVTLEHLKEIEEFEAAYRQRMPWRASRM